MNTWKKSFRIIDHFELDFIYVSVTLWFSTNGYKLVIHVYEGIDKVMSIHTPILDGNASVLQHKGWHSIFCRH
jgi:hypothetical protein